MMYLKKVSLLIVLWLVTGQVVAEEWLNQDSEIFKGSRLVYSQRDESANYHLVLSEIKKINSQWRADRDLKLDGHVERRTYLLRDGLSFREALPLLKLELQNKNAEPLFSCTGLDCGSSYGWANEFFELKELYGLDNEQAYFVWQVEESSNTTSEKKAGASSNSGKSYVAIYLVQRGNKRVYIQSDRIYPAQQMVDLKLSVQAFEQAIELEGYYVFQQALFKKDAATLLSYLRPVASYLNQNPQDRFWLVAHDYSAATFDEQKQKGLSNAEKIKQALVSLGVRESRLSLESVGELAPIRKQGAARVELVKRKAAN